MVHCSILGCNSNNLQHNENISYHRFPKQLPIRLSWIRAVGRPNWNPSKESRMCSKHFEAQCFRRTEKLTLLRKGSVPKLFVHASVKQETGSAEEPTDYADSSSDKEDLNNCHLKVLYSQKTTGTKKKQYNKVDPKVSSLRVKKLKEDISLLRKKSREDGIKIKCLQNKIRRLLRKPGKSRADEEGGQACERVQSLTDDESTESARSTPPSPPARIVDRLNFDGEIDLKTEPMDDDYTDCDPSATLDQEAGFEGYDMIEEIKTEVEDDPLMALGEFIG